MANHIQAASPSNLDASKSGSRFIFASYRSTRKVARVDLFLRRTQETGDDGRSSPYIVSREGIVIPLQRYESSAPSRGTHTLDCCCSSNKDSTHTILALTIAYSVTLSHVHAFLVEQAPTCSEYRPCLDDLRPASSCELSGPFPRTEEPFRALPVDVYLVHRVAEKQSHHMYGMFSSTCDEEAGRHVNSGRQHFELLQAQCKAENEQATSTTWAKHRCERLTC